MCAVNHVSGPGPMLLLQPKGVTFLVVFPQENPTNLQTFHFPFDLHCKLQASCRNLQQYK